MNGAVYPKGKNCAHCKFCFENKCLGMLVCKVRQTVILNAHPCEHYKAKR